jgi:hypothetical protein
MRAGDVVNMFGRKCAITTFYYPMAESKLSAFMGNIAASNAIWVKSFGIKRRKGNTKKTTSNLRFMAPVNYNKSFNKEEEVDVEVGEFQCQYHPNITTSSSVARKSSSAGIGYSSKEPSPSSAKKGTYKRQLHAADDKKPKKKERRF